MAFSGMLQRFLQEPHGVTSKKTKFFINILTLPWYTYGYIGANRRKNLASVPTALDFEELQIEENN
jgi:hypothetical protein